MDATLQSLLLLGIILYLFGCQKAAGFWSRVLTLDKIPCNQEGKFLTRSPKAFLRGTSFFTTRASTLNLAENENVLAEGWVNANFLHYGNLHKLKSKLSRCPLTTRDCDQNTHVALDLKYLVSSTAEQADNSGQMSALGVWLTLLIVAVAAAILS